MNALDLIKGALRRINSYQSGEAIAPWDASDCLDTLNDLFDSLSTDKLTIPGSNENIFQWIAGKSQYKIGNPTSAQLGLPPFIGTVTGGSAIITGITSIPANLIIGATLSDSGGALAPNVTVVSIGANSVSMSANALSTPSGADSIGYTVPGDFAIPRPLRITNGFTRFNQLDFTLDVYETQTQFTEILFKAQPGPWPTVAWYNNVMPYGLLNVYQTPGNNAEVHLFTDTILGNLTLYQNFFMPQGYTRAFKWLLAKEICAEFGHPINEAIKTHAADSLALIRALNEKPAAVSRYSRMLVRGNRANAGWIMDGGMGR